MMKKDLVIEIAKETSFQRENVDKIISLLLDKIGDALERKEKVQLSGFGTFDVKMCSEKRCRNPKTGEMILSPEHYSPKFKPGKTLRDKVR